MGYLYYHLLKIQRKLICIVLCHTMRHLTTTAAGSCSSDLRPVIVSTYRGYISFQDTYTCDEVRLTTKTGCKLQCSSKSWCSYAFLDHNYCTANGQCSCAYCSKTYNLFTPSVSDREDRFEEGVEEFYLFTREVEGASSDMAHFPTGLVKAKALLVDIIVKSPFTALQFLVGTELVFEMYFDFDSNAILIKNKVSAEFSQSEIDPDDYHGAFDFVDGREISVLFHFTGSGDMDLHIGKYNIDYFPHGFDLSKISQFKLVSENQEAAIVSISH